MRGQGSGQECAQPSHRRLRVAVLVVSSLRGGLGRGRRRQRGRVAIVTSSSSSLSSSRGDGDEATGDGNGARRSRSRVCGKLRALWKERWVGDKKSTLQDLRSCKWDFFFLLGLHLVNCICLTSCKGARRLQGIGGGLETTWQHSGDEVMPVMM